MKIGLYLALYQDSPLQEALTKARSFGCEMVEIACGGFIKKNHCHPAHLLDDEAARTEFLRTVEESGLRISALSCHGNPLHPDTAIARRHHEDFRDAVLLAEQTGVGRVCTFSGCPGDGASSVPNWVTCPWPDEYSALLRWQWEEKVIPYWREEAAFAQAHGVKVCVEMHPGFVVYNPESMRRLREASGEAIGCNFDPSHLFWQGIDPAVAIGALKDCIYHVHAKDTAIDVSRSSLNGVMDTKAYSRVSERSWVFRTVGYGHGELEWRKIVSALLSAGYDDVLSIEHEDSLAGRDAGVRKAVGLLQRVIL
jgi:sugar phosphate isomerase/epimerase